MSYCGGRRWLPRAPWQQQAGQSQLRLLCLRSRRRCQAQLGRGQMMWRWPPRRWELGNEIMVILQMARGYWERWLVPWRWMAAMPTSPERGVGPLAEGRAGQRVLRVGTWNMTSCRQ